MKNVKEIEITIEGKEWTDALDKAFNAKKKDIEVDGFRKGSVPKDIFIKKFGIESLFMDAVDLTINDAFKSLLKENENLKPVIEPIVDVTHICENDVTFKFTIISKPEVKLGEYKNLGVKKEKVEVTKDEIAAEIDKLRNTYAEVVEDNEATVKNGDTAVINFKGIVDGKELEGGTGENYPLEIGTNTFIPGFEEGLVGMKVGEEKVLNLKFPEEYTPELKNKDVEFTVTVTGIKTRVLPELGKDFYLDLGYENVETEEDFNNKVKENLTEAKEAQNEDIYINQLLEKAVANLEVEINDEIIDEEVGRILEQYTGQLQMQGLSLEQYLEFTKSDVEALKEQMKPDAVNRVKSRYLLEEIADVEKVEVTEKEVEEEVTNMAKMYGVSEEELLSMIGDKEMIGFDLKMRKAIEIIKNN